MPLLTSLALISISLLQYRPIQVNTEAVASFTGTLKSADKKFVILAVENSESLKMYVTGKTKFVREGKPSKVSAFHDGDKVTIDAERDVLLNLVAVQVAFPAKPEAYKEPK